MSEEEDEIAKSLKRKKEQLPLPVFEGSNNFQCGNPWCGLPKSQHLRQPCEPAEYDDLHYCSWRWGSGTPFCGPGDGKEGKEEDKCGHAWCGKERSRHRLIRSCLYCPGDKWPSFTKHQLETFKHAPKKEFFERLPLERCVYAVCRLKEDAHLQLGGVRFCPGWGIVDVGYFNSTGLDKVVIRQGIGEGLKKQERGLMHFALYLAIVAPTGRIELPRKLFSSRDGGAEPFKFQLGLNPPKVIRGWEMSLIGMRKGEIALLVCGPEMAYGAIGVPSASIPRDATLAFEMELVGIEPKI